MDLTSLFSRFSSKYHTYEYHHTYIAPAYFAPFNFAEANNLPVKHSLALIVLQGNISLATVLQVLLANFALLDFLTQSYKAPPVRVVLRANTKEKKGKLRVKYVVLVLLPQT